MRTAYRILAYLIVLEVLIQSAAIAFAVFGEAKWITGGGVLDKATIESHSANFTGVVGFSVHGMNGQYVVPLLALLLLVVSFFAKIPRGVMFAGIVFVLVLTQVFLGIFGRAVPGLGLLHGVNALVLFAIAHLAAHRTTASPAQPRTATPVGTTGVA
ncbi:MAG TPA: hypothetical protein VIY28_17360 [Pseudonocardiaceae bacterium]